MILAHFQIHLIHFTQYFLLLMVLHDHFLLSLRHHSLAFPVCLTKSVMLQIPISYTRNSGTPSSTSIPTYRISFYKLLKFPPNRVFLERFFNLYIYCSYQGHHVFSVIAAYLIIYHLPLSFQFHPIIMNNYPAF